MRFDPELHVDPALKDTDPADTKGMELRACCVCGVVKDAKSLEWCLSCNGYKCPEHIALPGLATLN